jgi:hypothetical protein
MEILSKGLDIHSIVRYSIGMSTNSEEAVRNYLAYLSDPASIVDQPKIDALNASVKAEKDPLAKLKLISERDRAQNVDASAVRGDFIVHAAEWAKVNNVTSGAFQQMGVGNDVLTAAGLLGKKGRGKAKGSAAPRGTRAPGVRSEGIRTAIAAKSGIFTISEIAKDTGATVATVTKVVNGMVEEGSIKNRGQAEKTGARGRAPVQFSA